MSTPDKNHPPENEMTRASLELLYHISRELTGALDLRSVLQRVIFLSMRTVGAISGSIVVLDDHGKPVDSAIITGEVIHDHATQRLRATLDRGLAGWVMRNRQAVLIPDTNLDDRWVIRQYGAEEPGSSKSAVSAPLLARNHLVGVMTLVHPKPGFFTVEHLALVQAISDQAGVAVLNARLYADSQRQAQVMTALAETAAMITGSLNLEAVLQRVLEQTSQALQVQAVSLGLIDIETRELVFRAATGWETSPAQHPRLKLGKGIAGWVAEEGHGFIVPDTSRDPRFDPETDQRTGLETKAIACAPIRYRGQVIGVLEALNPRANDFDPDALLVLTGIGSLAGSAIHHAQLFEQLQAAHQSYRELFDDSIDPIFVTDWHGNILEANRRATTIADYEKEILCRMNIRQLHVPDEEEIGEQFEKLTSKETLSYESLLRTRSQHDIPVQVHVHQVIIEEISRLQWILRDITERKNLDTMRDDLISMIYHDLRSPLANVVSSLDVLDAMFASEVPASKSLLNIAMRSVERIQRLTNSLLDMNRLEAGQPVGNRQPVDPYEIILDATDAVSAMAESKQQKIINKVTQRLPMVFADAEMICRVLTNLMENAIKYTPTESYIEIGAQMQENWMQIWVKDSGPGIPVSEHERIFDKFTRLKAKDSPKGLGLGLAYCQLAIQSHGGRIWVESEPDSGACFIFTLPLANESNR